MCNFLVLDNSVKKRLRLDEAAERLKVSLRTVYRLVRRGKLTAQQVRGCQRINPEQLPPGPLMRPLDAAKLLAVSPTTVYRWVDEGVIWGIKIGGSVRVSQKEIEGFFEELKEDEKFLQNSRW